MKNNLWDGCGIILCLTEFGMAYALIITQAGKTLSNNSIGITKSYSFMTHRDPLTCFFLF